MAGMLAALSLSAGCSVNQPKPPPPKMVNLPPRAGLPEFMKGTLYEVTNLENDNPFLVSGWGLVVNLNGTGGSDQISNNLKAFMAKELEAKGFGRKVSPTLKSITPELVLSDKNVAVVGVYGLLPPGARKGQWFDIRVLADQAGREEVKSLARGTLYDTHLTIDGANPINPLPPVNVWATASGPVFVNPAMTLKFNEQAEGAVTKSLRVGWVIGGGKVVSDRPLLLRLRQPENRLARTIEYRVNEYFHRDKVCTAADQAYCQLWLPEAYVDDWEHFSKVVLHLYLQGGSEAFARNKARQLVADAKKPGAPLQDISYCWEGLGKYAMPELSAVLADAAVTPSVRFAAARAAAYIGDPSGAAEHSLFDFASDQKNDFQLAAVQVLGRVRNSRAVNQLLRELLDSPQTTVRIEAYSILARNHDPSVETQLISSARDSTDQKFALDFVHSQGTPLIYATVRGIPRISIFGNVPKLSLPLTFSAMDHHLMLASQSVGRDVTLFYRDAHLEEPVKMSSPSDVANVIARLAGQYDDGSGHQMDFTYAEVLAVLQALTEQHKLRVTMPTGQELAASFMVQESTGLGDAIETAPRLDRGRPDGDNAAPRIEAPGPNSPARPQGPIGMVTDGNAAAGK
jgi:hypothetical protein